MTANASSYGTAGAASLAAALVVWSAAVVMAETGSDPDGLTLGTGLLGLALVAVGIAALVKTSLDAYTPEEV